MDLNRVQPEEQVLAKASIRHFDVQVGVHGQRAALTLRVSTNHSRAQIHRFQDSQSFVCKIGGALAISSRKSLPQSATVQSRLRDRSMASVSAAHMPKQFTLEQSFRQRPALTETIRPDHARRGKRVQGAGDHLLPCRFLR